LSKYLIIIYIIRYGGFRAATFCCLYTFQDLIQLESSINVYEIAKMYHLKRPGIWMTTNNLLFLYQSAECLFDDHLKKQLKNDGNMSSNSSTSITTPCSSISPNSAIIPISNRLSQHNPITSLDKIIKSNEPLYDNANLINTHMLPLSSQNNLNKKICGEHDLKTKTTNKATLSIGKRNAAMLLVNSVLTKSANFKRAFLASVSNSHGNNITEHNIADTATVIQKDTNMNV
jgi:hypothetical protein